MPDGLQAKQLIVNHALAQGSNSLLAQEVLGNGIAKLHGGGRTTAGNELTVLGNNVGGVLGTIQLSLHTGIAGCLHTPRTPRWPYTMGAAQMAARGLPSA